MHRGSSLDDYQHPDVGPVIEGLGLLDAEDDAAVAEALGGLLANPQKARLLGKLARDEVGDRYSLDGCVDEIEGVYERVLGR